MLTSEMKISFLEKLLSDTKDNLLTWQTMPHTLNFRYADYSSKWKKMLFELKNFDDHYVVCSIYFQDTGATVSIGSTSHTEEIEEIDVLIQRLYNVVTLRFNDTVTAIEAFINATGESAAEEGVA